MNLRFFRATEYSNGSGLIIGSILDRGHHAAAASQPSCGKPLFGGHGSARGYAVRFSLKWEQAISKSRPKRPHSFQSSPGGNGLDKAYHK